MKNFIFILIALLAFSSCRNINDKFPDFHLGTVEYYPKFLWSDSKLVKLEKEFIFEFSEDAKADDTCFAEFEFVDKDGNRFSTDIIHIEIDGRPINDNVYRVYSNMNSEVLVFSFSEKAESGKYQGFVRLTNHNLDRFGNQHLKNEESVEIMKWSIYYDKQWNPLALYLFMIICFIVIGLFFWYLILRPIFYPHFSKCRKSFIVMENQQLKSQLNIVFTGARMVIISNKKVQQSIFDRCFKGKIVSIVNPHFEEQLKFSPTKKKRIRVIGMNYISSPNPMPYNGISEIKNVSRNMNIIIR